MRHNKRLTFLSLLFILMVIIGFPNAGEGNSYTIYYESEYDGSTAIFKYASSGSVRVTDAGCVTPAVTSDGRYLYYCRMADTLWGKFWNVFYLVDGKERKLTTNEIYDEWDPAVSRDGSFAAFTSMREQNLEIITLPLDNAELAFRITNTPKPDEKPALATGDKWVYWTGRTGSYSYIFRAPGRGGEIERISDEGRTWDESPSISADGRWMAYASVDQNAPEETPASDETGTKIGMKYPGYGGGGGATYEPGDEKPAEELDDATGGAPAAHMAEKVDGNSEIWIMDLQTKTKTRLTNDAAWDGNPCISSDGKVIVFASDRDGNYEIYMINRDGSGLTRLTENDVTDDHPAIN